VSLLEVGDLHVFLGQVSILKEIGFTVAVGEMLGLIGPNGAGKSTLMKALAHIFPAAHGSVLLKGDDLRKLNLSERARRIAYMPQGAYFHWPLQVETAVALGRLPHLGPWGKMTLRDHRAVSSAMDETDVEALRGRLVTELAGGERTLVMLARAIAVEAELLLADEPVAGLDPNHQIQVMQLLKNLASQRGCGVIVVLHDLTLAARFCDRLLFLKAGRVLAAGPAEIVLSEKNLASGYGIEARSGRFSDGMYVIPWQRL